MPRRDPIRHFPQYFLYGEASQDVDESFLHVEAIAARSRLHDWKIRPHAHRDLNHLLLVLRGGGLFRADGTSQEFAAPSLLGVPRSCVHGFDFKPGTDGWIVTASGPLIGRIARDHPPLGPALDEASVSSLPVAALKALLPLFEMLVAEFHGNLPARRAVAEAALTLIIVQALRRKLEARPEASEGRSSDCVLSARFRALIESNYRSPLGISGYARRLAVSPERLRLACVRSTASSPLELLNARRLLEAKRSLRYTNMSVALIAETCGFLDPAYFSRFFARSTGKSPRAYRLARSAE